MKKDRYGGVMAQQYQGKVLSLFPQGDKSGRLSVSMAWDGKRQAMGVHQLVLLAFKGYPGPGEESCHDNGVASDNRIDNLYWGTHSQNIEDRTRHGRLSEVHNSSAYRKKMSLSIKRRWTDKNYRKKVSESVKKSWIARKQKALIA